MIGLNDGLYVIFAFIVSLVVSFAATPLVRVFAYKVGAIDVPKDGRRMHKKAIPRLGGLAIFYGVLVSMLCFGQWFKNDGAFNLELMGMLGGATIIVILGVFDDIKPRSAKLKFVIQILAALLVVRLGVRITYINNPFTGSVIVFPGWLSYIISVFWIVAVTNAVNLIDGLDGLAVGISSFAAISLLAILLLQSTTDVYLLVITAAIAGACFGFVPFNLNPAKIFMGDTGSTFLGFMLACISILGPFKKMALFSVPLMVLGLPLFDTSFAILRRIINGKPIMAPDRGHLHHRLVDLGFSQKVASMILVSFSCLLGLSAIILIISGASRALLLILIIVVLMVGGMNFMKHTDMSDEEDKEEDNTNVNKEK